MRVCGASPVRRRASLLPHGQVPNRPAARNGREALWATAGLGPGGDEARPWSGRT